MNGIDEKEALTRFAKRLTQCREGAGLTKKELAERIGVSIGNISRYESGIHGAGREAIMNMANFFKVSPMWLMGFDVPKHGEDKPDKIIPILGSVAAGTPIEAQEDVINTITVPENFNVDFGLKVKGNSMTGVGINDGDIVLIHQQPSLENGEIGVIDIEGEVTLKRFYVDDKKVMLLSENPANPPILINGKECTKKNLRILGKAIYFIGKVK